ncbi:senescence marker protein-30 family protein [Heterostelium album PN500]|uniref:Senescence marker protein-30 family protein n=1 Tax=Heterostelium pallidum (strain ATCC 26659 / Pp 5 / PN500) TaxID=670386 RepID=D3BH33_HETP5|nr:senescence marker protein-30 family protein [Heterostelium album PN500]EFA79417.1 senescence marker protein-30 family protein [Heterostelium album PN500]|eukprot:XP_020431538.1 senescence marker protein-30 family protein [Heterostelium album PN500]
MPVASRSYAGFLSSLCLFPLVVMLVSSRHSAGFFSFLFSLSLISMPFHSFISITTPSSSRYVCLPFLSPGTTRKGFLVPIQKFLILLVATCFKKIFNTLLINIARETRIGFLLIVGALFLSTDHNFEVVYPIILYNDISESSNMSAFKKKIILSPDSKLIFFSIPFLPIKTAKNYTCRCLMWNQTLSPNSFCSLKYSRYILELHFYVVKLSVLVLTETIHLKPELYIDTKSQLGEGSIWDNERQLLYWIDIDGKQLYVYDPKTYITASYSLPNKPGTIVPRCKGEPGEVVIALERIGVVIYNYLTGKYKVIANPEQSSTNRYNDGKCDPLGRFWVGSLSYKNGYPPEAKLYRVNVDHSYETMLEQVRISNGIVWTPDGSLMYYIDTPKLAVFRFNSTDGGKSYDMAHPTIVLRFDANSEGSPDGMTMDADGRLWIAHYDGSRVTCWDPKKPGSKSLYQIDLPVPAVTSCAFGGEDLSTLYITTANNGRYGGGGLFKINLKSYGIKGVPSYQYKG